MILESNAKEVKQSEDAIASHVKEHLEEYKALFKGIGKLTDIRLL